MYISHLYYPLLCWYIFKLFTSWLLWMMLQWIWEYNYLLKILFSILLVAYTEMGFLDDMVALFLIFGETLIAAISLYIPTSSACVSIFQTLTSTYFLFFFLWIMTIIIGVRWYFIVILIDIYLIISDVKHLLMYLLVTFCLLWRNVYLSLLLVCSFPIEL